MNTANLIANRLIIKSVNRSKNARPILLLAVGGITLGIIAMICSVFIVTGFQEEISSKVYGFMTDLRIKRFNDGESFDDKPINTEKIQLNRISDLKSVSSVTPFITKAGIAHSKTDIQGIVLKGVSAESDWGYFRQILTRGEIPDFKKFPDGVLISESISNKLNLKLNDPLLIFFIQKERKVRKYIIKGIYKSGLTDEFDNIYIIANIKNIQQINNWNNSESTGLEVVVKNKREIDNIKDIVSKITGPEMEVLKAQEMYPQIFNWLELQNLNVLVIIFLIVLVSGITMLSTLYIIVMENQYQIGLLKTIGASDQLISTVFLQIGLRILSRGLLIGNIISLLLCFIQFKWHLLKLNETDYYISYVPVRFNLLYLALLNTGVLLISFLILYFPAKIISTYKPSVLLNR